MRSKFKAMPEIPVASWLRALIYRLFDTVRTIVVDVWLSTFSNSGWTLCVQQFRIPPSSRVPGLTVSHPQLRLSTTAGELLQIMVGGKGEGSFRVSLHRQHVVDHTIRDGCARNPI